MPLTNTSTTELAFGRPLILSSNLTNNSHDQIYVLRACANVKHRRTYVMRYARSLRIALCTAGPRRRYARKIIRACAYARVPYRACVTLYAHAQKSNIMTARPPRAGHAHSTSGQTFMRTLFVVGSDTIVPVHFIPTANSRQKLRWLSNLKNGGGHLLFIYLCIIHTHIHVCVIQYSTLPKVCNTGIHVACG